MGKGDSALQLFQAGVRALGLPKTTWGEFNQISILAISNI